MQPRIFTYKITFEEVPYWYWGVHKELRYNESYLGSPVTNLWAWGFYTPRIQILEFFPFTKEGWEEACAVEKRLIKPDLNNPCCLNEGCWGFFSLEAARKGFEKSRELGVGIFGRTEEEMSEHGRNGGIKTLELGVGVHSASPAEKRQNGKKGGEK